MSNPVADGWKNYLHYFAKLGRKVDQMKENIDIQVGTKKSKKRHGIKHINQFS